MDDWVSLISQFGFPIVMTVWFMIITQKTMKEMTEAINKNTQMIEQLVNNHGK